jgi:hypothetical protein
MRRWIPLVLLIAIAGLIGLVLLRDSTPATPLAAGAAPARVEPASAPAAEVTAVESNTEPQRAALTPPSTSAVAKPDSEASQLTVRVLGKTSRAPVAKVRVVLAPASEPSSLGEKSTVEARGDLHTSPVTGADGVVVFDLPTGLDFRIHARNEDERFRPRGFEAPDSSSVSGHYSVSFEEDLPIQVSGQPARAGETSVLVPALRPGEKRELVLEFEEGLDGRVVGKVVCAETGEPVGGARVRILQGSQTRREYVKPGPDTVVTGNDGAFELAFALRAHPLLCVEAEGYGLRYANLDGLHADAAHALIVNVSRSASLNARLLDAAGAPIADASVELSVRGFMLSSSAADERGFFSSGMSMSFPPDEKWHAVTGADGRARVDALPAHIELTAEVMKAGKQLVHEPSGLQFQPGEAREIEWRVGGGAMLHGLVLDQDAKPVAGLEIWAAKKRGALSTQFLQFERDHVDMRTRTDGEGRFTLRELSAGNWSIGPAAERDSSVAPSAEVVEIADGAERELTLNVYRGLYIRGRVLTPTGEPAQGAQIEGTGKPGEYFEGGNVMANGEFRYGPLTPGTFTLYAQAYQKYSSSDPVSAAAGDSNVVLQLKLGGRIRGKVIDSVSGAACAAQLVFMPEGHVAGQFANGVMTSTNPDGTFERSGIEPGLWSVTATTGDGRFAQQAHLEVAANSDTGELVFSLSPGGKLQLSYGGSKPQLFVTIQSNGASIAFPDWVKSGASIQHLAPAGSLLLQIRSEQDGPARAKAIELKAGETKDVVLTDED